MQSNHFLKDEIIARVNAVGKRYDSLQELLRIRKDNLEDALKIYQFLRDVEEELQWITEKEPTAQSKDLGSSLAGVKVYKRSTKRWKLKFRHMSGLSQVLQKGATKWSRPKILHGGIFN